MTDRDPQRTVAAALAAAADALVVDFDLPEALHALATDATDVLDAALVGIMLTGRSGNLYLVTSSDEHADAIGLLQLQIYQRGPCVECLENDRAVSITRLIAHAERWPSFVTVATALGFHSLYALPMRSHTRAMGVFNLLRKHIAPLSAREVALAQAFADFAVISVHQQQCLAGFSHLAEQIHSTLNSRTTLEQARAVLAEVGQLDMRDAFALLRDHARAHRMALTDLARRIAADRDQARHVLTARS